MALFDRNKIVNNDAVHEAEPVRQQKLQVSPYESADITLELMSKICAAQPANSSKYFFDTYKSIMEKEGYSEGIDSLCSKYPDIPFEDSFPSVRHMYNLDIATALDTNEDKDYLRIVVAGGFSAGKSSFLNRLTGATALLPTGTDAVSSVKTYLHCDKGGKNIAVKGVNLKQALVDLDTNVLQALQHASHSNTSLGTVLEKLYVYVPSQDLDGLLFIDTPGYNNSERANEFSGKNDQQTAEEAMGEGDVLFWLIDSDKGTVNSKDWEMINKFEGKKLIIFNKADKKGEQESQKIVEAAFGEAAKYLDMNEVLDIMAYSAQDDRIYYSKSYGKQYSLKQILNKLRQELGSGSNKVEIARRRISELYQQEQQAQQEEETHLKKDLQEWIKEKNELFKEKNERQEHNRYVAFGCSKVLVPAYSRTRDGLNKMVELYFDIVTESDTVTRKIVDTNYSKWNTHDDINEMCWELQKDIEKNQKKCKRILKKAGMIYGDSLLELIVDWVESIKEERHEQIENEYQSKVDYYKGLESELKQHRQFLKELKAFSFLDMQAIEAGLQEAKRHSQQTEVKIEKAKCNVFEAIAAGDYKAFLRSFEEGLELSDCNAEGYTPLTFVAQHGNAQMMRFLLDSKIEGSEEIDYKGLDKRGYNPLHTAILAGERRICEMLLQHDDSLRRLSAKPMGVTKSIAELVAEQQSSNSLGLLLGQ